MLKLGEIYKMLKSLQSCRKDASMTMRQIQDEKEKVKNFTREKITNFRTAVETNKFKISNSFAISKRNLTQFSAKILSLCFLFFSLKCV